MDILDVKKRELTRGATLYYIKDEKYKTNYLNAYFTLPLCAENITKMSLLSRILKRGSSGYPSMSELNSALDTNYASTLTLTATKSGEKAVFLMGLATLKNEFAPNGEDIFSDAVDIMFNLVNNPLIEDGAFRRDWFESEKKNLRDSILSQINNKASYARGRFIAEMCKGEPYAVNGEGDIGLLETITPESLFAFLRQLLLEARINIFFVGSESEERVASILTQKLSALERKPVVIDTPRVVTEVLQTKDLTESLDISQGHLYVGFRTPVTYSHPDYMKFVLFNMVLGGDVSSKMFMNIREKLSLCYTCYSALDGAKGILSAYAGISPENKEKTLSALMDEIENVKEGRVSEDELEDAKKAYINRMREIEDNPSLLAPWYQLRLDRENMTPPSCDAEKIASLKLCDVVEAAREIKLDTVYFLTKTNT